VKVMPSTKVSDVFESKEHNPCTLCLEDNFLHQRHRVPWLPLTNAVRSNMSDANQCNCDWQHTTIPPSIPNINFGNLAPI
jgi:hypothetical protein